MQKSVTSVSTDELRKYFQESEVEQAKRLVTFFHGQLLVDSKLSDTDTILPITYMRSNEAATNKVSLDAVRDLYVQVGRDAQSFSKALYELAKRKKKASLVKDEDGNLSLTFTGLSKIKGIIQSKKEQ